MTISSKIQADQIMIIECLNSLNHAQEQKTNFSRHFCSATCLECSRPGILHKQSLVHWSPSIFDHKGNGTCSLRTGAVEGQHFIDFCTSGGACGD